MWSNCELSHLSLLDFCMKPGMQKSGHLFLIIIWGLHWQLLTDDLIGLIEKWWVGKNNSGLYDSHVLSLLHISLFTFHSPAIRRLHHLFTKNLKSFDHCLWTAYLFRNCCACPFPNCWSIHKPLWAYPCLKPQVWIRNTAIKRRRLLKLFKLSMLLCCIDFNVCLRRIAKLVITNVTWICSLCLCVFHYHIHVNINTVFVYIFFLYNYWYLFKYKNII